VALGLESSVTIDELLNSPLRFEYAAMPESDALTEEDSLREADLLDVRVNVTTGTLALLFDLRVALGFRMADTAVLAMRQVFRLEVATGDPPKNGRRANYVMGNVASVNGGRFSLRLDCLREWDIVAESAAAEFYVGNVPGLPEAPANYGFDDERTIVAGMQAWSSQFEPGWATFIHPFVDGADG
jgi:hypothetical protein